MADTCKSTRIQVTSNNIPMNTDDERSPPSYGAEDQSSLLPPPYHSLEDDYSITNDTIIRSNGPFSTSRGRSGTLSKCWKWIAKEMTSSTNPPSHRRNSDMCFGACCRG
ncbi:hypothetical protein V8C37DRAFT_377170 [Trichoderma ceciliae]